MTLEIRKKLIARENADKAAILYGVLILVNCTLAANIARIETFFRKFRTNRNDSIVVGLSELPLDLPCCARITLDQPAVIAIGVRILSTPRRGRHQRFVFV